MQTAYKHIYGPVYSWRLGMSLGIDPLGGAKKICNFDCVYCQLGRTVHPVTERGEFVPAAGIIDEIRSLPSDMDIDYLTFSGRGEPTLAKNLGEMITALRAIRDEKIAVISNSALIGRKDVQDDFSLADYVMLKLDACSQESLAKIDNAVRGIRFRTIIEGMQVFRKRYKGKLALQIMFIEENKSLAGKIADIARTICADEIQLNTPLRPSQTPPLSTGEMDKIKNAFLGLPLVSVYKTHRYDFEPMSVADTVKRHGEF